MGTDSLNGLSEVQAQELLHRNGLNLVPIEKNSALDIFIRQFRSPFNFLLMGAALLAIILKEKTDAILIIFFTLLNTSLGFYQEYRSEQTIKLLMNFLKHKSTVLHDGLQKIIDSENVVVGDVIVLKAGNIIPADCKIHEVEVGLEIDESSLTGESFGVSKNIGHTAFAGTTILKGSAKALVTKTGINSQLGELANASSEIERGSNFEKNIGQVSYFTLKLITIILLSTYLTNLLLKGMGSFLEITLFSIALAVSVIPEALPVVITFSLSRGATSLAMHKVIVKRLSAIEDLGGIEILITDKTGTITENKILVSNIKTRIDPLVFKKYLGYASSTNDSIDKALLSFREENSKNQIVSIPFDPLTRYSQTIVEENNQFILIEKGTIEQVITRTNSHLTSEEESWILKEESLGHRVIAVSKNHFTSKPNQLSLSRSIQSISGFVSFSDQLKKSAISAIQKAKNLGVDIRIISGDSAIICENIGKYIGLISDATEVKTESQLLSLSQKEFHEIVRSTKVFARITPIMKSRIVDVLQENATVGFVGDGVNDGPALKSADVGIAVYGASDIAKSASDIILRNRSLLTIVNGIEEGRLVFANTSKYIKMTLAANVGNFFSVAIASLLIPYLPMLPLQILMVNLLSDFPMIAVAGDSTDKNELSKPLTYNIHEIASTSIIFGLLSSVFDFIFFSIFVRLGQAHLQTGWFIESIVTELLFFYSIRSRLPIWKAIQPPWGITLLSGLVIATTIGLPYTKIGQVWIGLTPIEASHIFTIFTIIGFYLISTELLKVFYFKRDNLN